jgi:hypothetical protein
MPPWRGKKRKSPNQHRTRSILDIFPARARINADTTVAAQTSADLAPCLPIESFSSEAAAAAAQDTATKKQPSRSTKTKQPVDYCVSDLESEDDGDEATDSDSDEFKLGHNTDEEDESIEGGEDEEVPYASNLVDEEAVYKEEREKVAEDELCRLEKQLETNAIANLNKCNSIGLNSARKVKDHFFDTHIPFDKTALLVEAIKLFNALSPEEKKRQKERNPSHPFYVFASFDIHREFPRLTADEIEQLDPDVIIAKVGILVKAWSKTNGDNSVKKLCGGNRRDIKSGFYRSRFFLLQVVHSHEKFIQFATSVEIDGGRARVATLKRLEFLRTGNPAFILLREATEGDSPVGDVLAKFGSISQAGLAIHTNPTSITKAKLQKEGGVTISRFNLTHNPETCIETFLDIPMLEDHEERFATLMDVRIVEICRPGVLLSQVSYSDLIVDNDSHLDDDDGWVEIEVKRETSSCANGLIKRIKAGEIFAADKIKQSSGKRIDVSERLIRSAMNYNNGTSHGGLFTERIFQEKGRHATDKKWGRGTDGKWIWTLTDNRLFLSQNNTFFERGEDNHYHEI